MIQVRDQFAEEIETGRPKRNTVLVAADAFEAPATPLTFGFLAIALPSIVCLFMHEVAADNINHRAGGGD